MDIRVFGRKDLMVLFIMSDLEVFVEKYHLNHL